MSEYKTYIELFNKASKKSIQDILDDEFYQEILLAKEHNCYYQIKDKYETIMHNFIASDRERIPYVKLRHNLVRNFLWTDLDLHKFHYNAFNLLSGYIHKELDLNSGDWVNAIAMAIFGINNNIINIYPKEIDDEYAKNSYPQQYYSVQACKFFKNKGFKISVKNGEIKFNNIQDIFVSIDNQAKKFGVGLYFFITDLMKELNLNKNSNLYEFRISSGEPILPLGFMYQLSLKNIREQPVYTYDKLIREKRIVFLDYCRNFSSLFEFQNFGHDFELILMQETKSMLNKLQEIIHIDNFFKIEQYNYSDVIDFVLFLSKNFINDDELKDDMMKFQTMVEFFENQVKNNKNMIFEKQDMPKEIGDDFFYLFCFKYINQDFKTTFDFDKIDFKAKPFVEMNGKFLIIEPQFSAISLYIILCNILTDKKSAIGYFIESYLVDKMKLKFNHIIHNSEYKISKPLKKKLELNSDKLECDIVLQSEKYIIFIELKKKELTRNAKSGDIFFILQDLSQSLLSSHLQANKHMRFLMENKKIEFEHKDNENKISIELNDREIIKISLTSLDYLSLHSKDVFHQFIKLFFDKTILISDNFSCEQKKILEKFNKLNKELSEDLFKIHSTWQIEKANGFFNSLFLSIFHLLFIINRSDNIECMVNNLLKNKQLTIGGYRDFYHEFIYLNQLQQIKS